MCEDSVRNERDSEGIRNVRREDQDCETGVRARSARGEEQECEMRGSGLLPCRTLLASVCTEQEGKNQG
jgi:hypothetical protein